MAVQSLVLPSIGAGRRAPAHVAMTSSGFMSRVHCPRWASFLVSAEGHDLEATGP